MRILLAAADRDLLECYRQILSDRFGETVTAFDGTQVFSLLGTEPFDLVILDRDLPRMDHQSLTGRIHTRKIPLVVLSAEQEDGQTENVLNYPFTPAQIIAAAEKAAGPAAQITTERNDPEGREEKKGGPEDE